MAYYSDPSWYTQNIGQGQLSALAAQYGMTASDLAQFMAQNNAADPGTAVTQQNTGYGMTSSVANPNANASMNQTLQTLAAIKQFGLGGGQQAASQNPALDPSSATNPVNAMSALGAAALQMPMVLNPTPGQGQMSKGGVNPIEKAAVGSSVPNIPSQYQNAPGVFAKAPMPQPSVASGTAAFTPTPQATGAAYNPIPTPFASAPAAPGVNWTTAQAAAQAGIAPPGAAHTSALANAGMALFAHYGGDPNTASHADIANFHNQLTSLMGGAPGGTAGTVLGQAPAPAKEPVKMQHGGVVPGDPNDDSDSVDTKLSPGEIVIPKARKRLTERPAPMQAASNPPAAPGAAATSDSGTTNQASGQSGSRSPSSSGQIDWNAIAQARQQRQAWNALGTNAYQAPVGSSAMTVGDVAGGAAIPGGGQTQSLGKLGGAGGGAGGAGGAISGLASGLSAAAQAYADSIKPWQVQASHIPNPDEFKNRYYQPTFGQPGA